MIGKIVSHYKILEKLGEGGMGIVYKAQDIKLDRLAALKFLPLHYISNEDAKSRFITEAKITSSLDHPNICTLYEIDEYMDSQLFISMAYYDGETLKQKIDNGNMALADIIDYSIQMAQGLLKAHRKGILHSDIKPANIIITTEGLVKILDFGIARLLRHDQITKDNSITGTIAYMSPEQITGDELDNRTDIFSFGIVLYEMLTGRLPFTGDYDQAITYSILNEEPVNIMELNPAAELNDLVLKCLRKDKLSRFNSFEEVLNELQNVKLHTGHSLQGKPNGTQKELIKNFIPQKNSLFIGREKQVKVLQDHIGSVFLGKGKTLFISGEPGIGKTQLIFTAAKNYSKQDFHILYGRCLFNESGLPYHPFVSAVKEGIAYREEMFFNELTNTASLNNINLTNRLPIIRSFINLTGDYSNTLFHKEQLWDAVFILFKILSSVKPVILVMDDLQWADKATIELISYFAVNIINLPVMLICVFRPYETSNEAGNSLLIETIRNLCIEDLAEIIELERLSEVETHEIVVKELGSQNVDAKVSRKIFKQSEGNPLFINELLTLMKIKGLLKFSNGIWQLESEDEIGVSSGKVKDVIKQRIDQLDDLTREILEVASCEGEYFQSDILSGCLNINRIKLLKKLQALENESHIIRHEKNSYRFDHILIRDVLYESILPELREEYHKIISRWLIEKYGGSDEFASRIAYHLTAAGEEEQSIDYMLKAACRERDFYAVEDAAGHFSKLLKILRNTKNADNNYLLIIKEGLGDTTSSTGKLDEAIEHYTQYLKLARAAGKQDDIIKALRKLSECCRMKGELNKAENLCSEAVKLAYKIDNKKEQLESLNTSAFINASRGNYNMTIDISHKTLALSDEINDLKNKSISLSNLGFAYWHLGNYPLALGKFTEALKIQRSIGDNRGVSISLNYLTLVYWKLGKYEHALDAGFEAVKIKKSISDYRTIPGSLNGIGDAYRDIGEYEKAADYHKQSLILATEHGNKGGMCDNLRDLGEDYLLLGDFSKSLNYYTEVRDLAISANLKWYETRSYISLSELYLFLGKLDEAKKYLSKGIENSYELNAGDLIIEALWKKSLILAEENLYTESINELGKAIEIAVSINHITFLWKLYLDLGKIFFKQKNYEKTKEAINNSYSIVKDILKEFTDENIRNTYMKSPKIKELFLMLENRESSRNS